MQVWPGETIFIVALLEGIGKIRPGQTIFLLAFSEDIGASIARSDNI